MIKTELLNGGKFIRHYSDAGRLLRQVETGIEYSEAIDLVPCRYTYEETETPAEGEEATEADYLAALAELGVSE